MSAAEEALATRLERAPGLAFRSRMPVGRLIADFGSYQARVVVEIDGDAHDTRRGDMHARTTVFESAGYLVLRFSEDEVLADADAAMDQIEQAMKVWGG